MNKIVNITSKEWLSPGCEYIYYSNTRKLNDVFISFWFQISQHFETWSSHILYIIQKFSTYGTKKNVPSLRAPVLMLFSDTIAV
jgi:hypothetical protein